MGLFDNPRAVGEVGFGAAIGSELMKALEAGYGTDSASMAGGRALIPQDIERSVINALNVKKADFKLMNLLKSEKVGSTVHEYTRRKDAGEYALIFGQEGGNARESNQSLERVTKLVKYMQTYREITLQMRVAKTLEDAEASEKEAGIFTILKGAEYGCFHGHAGSVPEQFDSVVEQIVNGPVGPNNARNIYDLRGATLLSKGEVAIKEIARMVFDNGGSLSHSFMPSVLASDLQDVVKDRLRLDVRDKRATGVVESYPTPFSSDILIAGAEGGPDKMFFPRNPISAIGVAADRPNAPSIALAAASDAASKFVAADAGTYTYAVHAIDENGISAASATASQAVTAGQKVTITITPDGTKPGTGFIVTRGKKGVTTDLREIVRVAKAATATTAVVDLNEVLPGTGDILLVSHDVAQPSMQWDSFLPAMKFDLYPTRSAIIPFLICLFGAADVKVPWFHGIIRNASPADLGWY